MTEETFKIANELNERIKKLSFELSLWKENIEIINVIKLLFVLKFISKL